MLAFGGTCGVELLQRLGGPNFARHEHQPWPFADQGVNGWFEPLVFGVFEQIGPVLQGHLDLGRPVVNVTELAA